MTNRPYVLLSVAMSVDGCIDDTTGDRLILSNEADFDEVDQIRAESDAILIGATALRRDNPRLLVKNTERRAERVARGEPDYPLKVTITASGDLDPELKFWHDGGAKLVYTTDAAAPLVRERLGELAGVASTGEHVDMAAILDDLGDRGIRRLMVEGGGSIHTQFLAAGLADEIRCAVAPFFIGDPAAPRFVGPAQFANGPSRRMVLDRVEAVGDLAVLHYLTAASSGARSPGWPRPLIPEGP
jgi:riboflavin-specific deaminase-like protein